MPNLAVSEAGLLFVARWEGERLLPYNDAVGNATIGYGHLLHRGPVTDVDRQRWVRFSGAKALALLRADLASTVAAINRDVRPPLSLQRHMDALVSFVFNVGAGAFAESTLLRLLNDGVRGRRAADELLRWDHAGGRRLAGLTRRRQAERLLWLEGEYGE